MRFFYKKQWARVAELADASDSKSEASQGAWGFESPLWHQRFIGKVP